MRRRERGLEQRCKFHLVDFRKMGQMVSTAEFNFDIVISMWTSLGYFGESIDHEVLIEASKRTRLGGIVIIQVTNRDHLIRAFRPVDITSLNNMEIQERRALDLGTSTIETEWRFFDRKDEDLIHRATVLSRNRLYSLEALIKLLEASGWKYRSCYGDLNMSPVTLDSASLLAVGQK